MAGEERGVEQGLVAAWPARRAWAERLHAWKEASHQVFAFFLSDVFGFGRVSKLF
jgi:hypothetical protein